MHVEFNKESLWREGIMQKACDLQLKTDLQLRGLKERKPRPHSPLFFQSSCGGWGGSLFVPGSQGQWRSLLWSMQVSLQAWCRVIKRGQTEWIKWKIFGAALAILYPPLSLSLTHTHTHLHTHTPSRQDCLFFTLKISILCLSQLLLTLERF